MVRVSSDRHHVLWASEEIVTTLEITVALSPAALDTAHSLHASVMYGQCYLQKTTDFSFLTQKCQSVQLVSRSSSLRKTNRTFQSPHLRLSLGGWCSLLAFPLAETDLWVESWQINTCPDDLLVHFLNLFHATSLSPKLSRCHSQSTLGEGGF